MTFPLSHQVACVRHVTSAFREDGTIRQGAEEAIKTLEWIQANRDVIRAAYRLLQHPAVSAVFDVFEGAELMELPHVRASEDSATGG